MFHVKHLQIFEPHHRCGGPPPLVGEARKLRSKPPIPGEVSRSDGGVPGVLAYIYYFFLFSIISCPPMYGLRISGTVTVPSAFW